MSTTHNCHKRCSMIVPYDRLFCYKHWIMLPKLLRHQVNSRWALYNRDKTTESFQDYMKVREEAHVFLDNKLAPAPAGVQA